MWDFFLPRTHLSKLYINMKKRNAGSKGKEREGGRGFPFRCRLRGVAGKAFIEH